MCFYQANEAYRHLLPLQSDYRIIRVTTELQRRL